MMNRRGFFGSLAAILAGATLDPEKLLWVPRKKLISIPPPRWAGIDLGLDDGTGIVIRFTRTNIAPPWADEPVWEKRFDILRNFKGQYDVRVMG
jgi:hypothetical protein